MSVLTPIPETGPLSPDQAVEFLRGSPALRGGAEAPSPAPEPASTPALETDGDEVIEPDEAEQIEETPANSPADEQPSDPEGDNAEAEEEPAPEIPASEAPQWWSAEAKAKFAELDPAIQDAVLKQETHRQKAINTAQEQAVAARKEAERVATESQAKAQEAVKLTEKINELVPKLEGQFKSRWENVDWVAWSQTDPDACLQGRILYEAEQRQLQDAQRLKQEADVLAQEEATKAEEARYQAWAKDEQAKLLELVPAFADKTTGEDNLRKTVEFAVKAGATPEQLKFAGALEWSLIYDAMRWRDAQAAAKARTAQPKHKPPAPRSTAKPGASNATTSSQRNTATALDRLSKTGTVEDAVAALRARRQGG